jgi:hypothetical protein
MAIIIHKKDGSEVSAGTSLMYNAGFDEKPEVQYQTAMPWDTPPQKAMRARFQSNEVTLPRGVSSATRILMTRPITGDDVRDQIWYETSVAIDLLIAAKECLKDKIPLWHAFLSELKILEKKLFNAPETIRNVQVSLREMARIAQKYGVPLSEEVFKLATKKVPPTSGALSGSPYDTPMGSLGMGFFKKLKKFAGKVGRAAKSAVKKTIVQPTKFLAKKVAQPVKFAAQKTQQAGKFVGQKTKQAAKFTVQKTKQAGKFVGQKAKQLAKWTGQQIQKLLKGLKRVFVDKIVGKGKSVVTSAFRRAGLSGSPFGHMGYIGVNSGDFGYARLDYLSSGMGGVDAVALTKEFATDYVNKKWSQIVAIVGAAASAGGLTSLGTGAAPAAIAAFVAKVVPDAVSSLKEFAAKKANEEKARLENKAKEEAQRVTNRIAPAASAEDYPAEDSESGEDTYEENSEEYGAW